jgi:Fe-S cluster assembly iron-binding protein IscA
MLQLTDAAVKAFKDVLAEQGAPEYGIRIFRQSGG